MPQNAMTKEVKSIRTRLGNPFKDKNYSLAIHSSMQGLKDEWEAAAPKDNIFLQSTYLQLLENNAPEGMRFCYLIFYKNGDPIGVADCQILHFKVDQSLKEEEEQKQNTPCFFSTFGRYIKGFVSSKVEFNTLVCGNLLLTGEHSAYFEAAKVNHNKSLELLDEAMMMTQQKLEKDGLNVSVFLVKEFYEENKNKPVTLKDKSYNEFTIQPNMVFDLRSNWKTFEDYLGDMTSKYRVRAKRARKKGVDIVRVPFDAEKIQQNLNRIYDLYLSIADKSGFNAVTLNKNYFLALKQELKDDFNMVGYYINDELVAFYTTIKNGHELEAHFLGFDRNFNPSHQVYLNILYDIVNIGIENQVEKIVFARTALEIKSSVGAVAHDMYCYVRHRNSFSNRFINPLLDYLKPDKEWVPRQPFKPITT